MKNSEVIYMVKQQTDKGLLSKDSSFSDAQILFYLLRNRATFLRRKFRDYKYLAPSNQMITPCIPLIEATSCPCIPPDDCMIMVTEHPIPQSITGIISVTNPDGTKEYVKTDSNLAKYRANQRIKLFADNTSYYEHSDNNSNKLYIFSQKPLKAIRVTLIPENPEEVQRMVDCDNNEPNKCVSTYDLEWICDPEITKGVIDETIKVLLSSRSQVTDVYNDNNDNNVGNRQEQQ